MPDLIIPSIGDAIAVPAHCIRDKLASRRDLMATRAVHKSVGLPRPNPPHRIGHIIFVYDVITPVNHAPVIFGAEYGENGCRAGFRIMPGDGPYDLYTWPPAPSWPPRIGEPFIDTKRHLQAWWKAHDGEGYGYLSYLRLWYMGLKGSNDWSKVKLRGTGLVCSTSWAKAWWDNGRRLYEEHGLDWSLMSPHMVCAGLDLKATGWYAP